MSSAEVSLRPAEKKDAKRLCELIQELALHEQKEPPQVTIEDVLTFGFSERKLFSIEIAELEEEMVGYALYYFTFRTCAMKPVLYLEDLYVQPQHRRKGIAKALLGKLQSLAEKQGATYFELSVFDWNLPAQAFYETLGGKLFPGMLTIRFPNRS